MSRVAYWLPVLIVAGLAGYAAGHRPAGVPAVPAPPATSGARILLQDLVITLFADMAPLPAFVLRDAHGPVMDNDRLLGHFTLVAFGASDCRDGCPATRAATGRMLAALPAGKWQALFIALDGDPNGAGQSPAFVTATGPRAQILRLAGALRAPDDAARHDHRLWLLDPQGRWYGLLAAPLDEARALDRLRLAAELYARRASGR